MEPIKFRRILVNTFAVLLVILQGARTAPKGLEGTEFYIYGSADPERDHSAVATPQGYICSNLTRECYCKGRLCSLLADVVVRSNITVLTLTHTSIQTVTSRAYVSVPQLEVLDIIQSNLSRIEPYSFYGLKRLRVLNMCFNKISQLSPKAFVGLNSLEELVLMSNEISRLDAVVLAMVPKTLPVLKLLHLGGNHLKEIHENTFKPMKGTKLDYLQMFLCSLKRIDPKGLEPLTNLKSLMIRGNDELSEDTLSSVLANSRLIKLDVLDISASNKFPSKLLSVLGKTHLSTMSIYGLKESTLISNSFPEMVSLEILELPFNRLQVIEVGALNGLANLRILKIPKNLMISFPEALQIPHLESLDISGHPKHLIKFDLPESTFSTMVRLTSLDLSHKTLLTLNKNTFYGLSNLTLLNVRKCGINSVEDGAFKHLTSLRRLDISENPLFELGVVSEKLFYGLQQTLESLLLQDVGYRGADDRFWDNLVELQTLDISNNTLFKVSAIVPRLKNLKRLYASSNDVQEWNEQILTGNSTLETLDLSQYSLRVVTGAMLEDFKKVAILNISQNLFKCNCDFKNVLQWSTRTNSRVLWYKSPRSSSRIETVCGEPNDYLRMSIQETLAALSSSCDQTSSVRMRFLLAFLAVVLIIVFTFTIFIYTFRRRLRQSLLNNPDLSGSYMYDAFVSYSANDSEWVFDNLLPHLEDRTSNLRLCVYDRDFLAGEAITDCILESIRNSRRVLLVVSNHFVKSPWCRLETELARHILVDDDRDGLLLIRLGPLDLSKVNAHLRFLLSTKLYLSWSTDPKEQEEFWNKLKRALDFKSKQSVGVPFSKASIL